MVGRTVLRSFALGGLVWSAQALKDERRTTDHEHDAGGACDEMLELVVGVDLALITRPCVKGRVSGRAHALFS